MKIAMIGQKKIPSRDGGVEVVVGELSSRMVQGGNEVVCYNRYEDTRNNPPRKWQGVKMVRVFTFKAQSLNAAFYSFVAAFISLFGHFDIMHYHAEGPSFMTFLPKLFGYPVVVTIHGLDWQRAKWGNFAAWYIKQGEKMAAKMADALIVLSKENQRYFKETYGRETYYIPNGVTIHSQTRPEVIREKWGLKKDSYILFMARLVPEKGAHYLIEAFRRINTDKRLVIAGPLKSTDYVRHLQAQAAGDDRILFTDFVQGKELEELMSNCYVYVLPSDIEGMPLSLLEAMSYGSRCIVSDISENRETSGSFADYFSKGDSGRLKERLEKVLTEGERDRSSKLEEIDFVRHAYDWDIVMLDTMRVYWDVRIERLEKQKLFRGSQAGIYQEELQENIKLLENKRNRLTLSILDCYRNGKDFKLEDVRYFKRYSSEIEILADELKRVRKIR